MNQHFDASQKEIRTFQDWDPDALSRMVGNDPAILRRFLEMFLTRSQEQLNTILDALEANDTQLVASTAHTLKSTARSVGAERLGNLCQTLETAGKTDDLETSHTVCKAMIQALNVARQLIAEHLAR